jgi:hypothetical protein
MNRNSRFFISLTPLNNAIIDVASRSTTPAVTICVSPEDRIAKSRAKRDAKNAKRIANAKGNAS